MSIDEIDQNEIYLKKAIDIGIFNLENIRELFEVSDLKKYIEEESDYDVKFLIDNWVVINNPESLSSEIIRKIAWYSGKEEIPIDDIRKAIYARILYQGKKNTEFSKIMPSKSSVMALISFLSEDKDFNLQSYKVSLEQITDPIEPDSVSEELLYKLESSVDNALSASKLAYRMNKQGQRWKIYEQIVPMSGFAINDDKLIRLVGTVPNPKYHKSDTNQAFIDRKQSNDGNIQILQYQLNNEIVECNSFNIPIGLKKFIEGTYTDITTGRKIGLDCDDEKARKIIGVGPIVRKLFEYYVEGQILVMVINKEENNVDFKLFDNNDKEIDIYINNKLIEQNEKKQLKC